MSNHSTMKRRVSIVIRVTKMIKIKVFTINNEIKECRSDFVLNVGDSLKYFNEMNLFELEVSLNFSNSRK